MHWYKPLRMGWSKVVETGLFHRRQMNIPSHSCYWTQWNYGKFSPHIKIPHPTSLKLAWKIRKLPISLLHSNLPTRKSSSVSKPTVTALFLSPSITWGLRHMTCAECLNHKLPMQDIRDVYWLMRQAGCLLLSVFGKK